ncbi:hypothetical protein KDH83_20385, partial [Achromobacter sp. Marseille-Q0513]|uniref:hypothetical protein n=1 Tax=Achromobacter sp. Marseille-Q0513 TaxID=2829161 RepID=UPI001B905031
MRRLSHSRRPAALRQPTLPLRAGFAAVVLARAAGPAAAQNVPLPSGAEPGRQLPQPAMPESTTV